MLEYLLSDSTSVRKVFICVQLMISTVFGWTLQSSVEVLAELLQQSDKKIELPMKPEVLAMIKVRIDTV